MMPMIKPKIFELGLTPVLARMIVPARKGPGL